MALARANDVTEAAARGGHRCWVCGSASLALIRPSTIAGPLGTRHFAVTDYSYGTSHSVWRCADCGFLECPEIEDPLRFYNELVDPEYEEQRAQRGMQAAKLLRSLRRHAPGGRLLDVGAGTGILVEQAQAAGYAAEGIEPSDWMRAVAVSHGLTVHPGTLPSPLLHGGFDAVTLVDVVEHVPEPLALLRAAAEQLAPGGVIAVITPDVGSLAARLLGWRWWHFRPAHIGYFDRKTLALLGERAGLTLRAAERPGWVFGADYLIFRAQQYLPAALRFPVPGWTRRLSVPFNLYDSLLFVFAR